jgi:hypothetical protein
MSTERRAPIGDEVISTETSGERIGAGVSLICVDLAPGRGPALHRHPRRSALSGFYSMPSRSSTRSSARQCRRTETDRSR